MESQSATIAVPATHSASIPTNATTSNKKDAAASSKSSSQAKLVGSGTAGLLELLLFHPIDTAAKRLMSNQKPIFGGGKSFSSSMSEAGLVIFKKAEGGLLSKYVSLFPGLTFAAGYKISQRIYKFGGQPVICEYLDKHHGALFQNTFGAHANTMKEATAGSLIGVGEIVLLPLDVLKIKSQTNIEALKKRSMVTIIKEEGLGRLYKGAVVTALRNAPGSFALFGGSAFTKEKILGHSPKERLSFFHYFLCSTVGAICSLVITNPLDVIKTRTQNKPFESKVTGWRIAADTLSQEGPAAFFKGLTPKLLAVSPKLIFSFTVAQYFIDKFDTFFRKV